MRDHDLGDGCQGLVLQTSKKPVGLAVLAIGQAGCKPWRGLRTSDCELPAAYANGWSCESWNALT